MIPRRKIPIDPHDISEWINEFYTTSNTDVHNFESAFKQYMGCQYAIATTSGRDALELALDAIHIQSDDEIIIPAYTLGELLPLINATLVPADIEKDTFNINPNDIQRKITNKTKAILATHLFGAPCDIETICQLANEKNIAVIEDCAHAAGASVSGKKAGSFGHAAIFSLEVNKAVSTYGGGILTTNEKKIADVVTTRISNRKHKPVPALRKAFITWMEEMVIRSPLYAPLARILFSDQISKQFENFYRGTHNRVRTDKVAYSNFQARIGMKRLSKLDRRNYQLNRRWNQLASALPKEFIPQNRIRCGNPSFYNFVCLYNKDVKIFRRKFSHMGIDVGINSEVMDDCARLLDKNDCPVANYVHRHAVLFPLYESMTEKEFYRLLAALEKAS